MIVVSVYNVSRVKDCQTWAKSIDQSNYLLRKKEGCHELDPLDRFGSGFQKPMPFDLFRQHFRRQMQVPLLESNTKIILWFLQGQ